MAKSLTIGFRLWGRGRPLVCHLFGHLYLERLNVQVVGESQSATAVGPDTSTEPEGEGDGYYAKRQPPVILNLGQVQPQLAT